MSQNSDQIEIPLLYYDELKGKSVCFAYNPNRAMRVDDKIAEAAKSKYRVRAVAIWKKILESRNRWDHSRRYPI